MKRTLARLSTAPLIFGLFTGCSIFDKNPSISCTIADRPERIGVFGRLDNLTI